MSALAQDSLPPLKDGKAPTNLEELWGDYDPRKEPLETQVVREWEEGGITLRYVVFNTGVFKGKPAKLAGFYGFVKGGARVPGILHVHGGGQNASLDAVRDTARNGYACLSINWGHIKMDGAKDEDPNTDWGALDATQRHNDHYAGGKPDAKTLDEIESPRNNNWFLLVLAARRGLTFLEQQPEVEPDKLGVTGHSMGGKITTDLAGIDKRVKAAVPSCGGAGRVSGRLSGMPGAGLGDAKPSVYDDTIDTGAYIPRVTCPILWMAPANDFAGPFDNMTESWKRIGSKEVAYTIVPHMNHRGIPESAICSILWFDQHLKGSFTFPKTPELTVTLKTANGVPRATLKPDRLAEVVKVDLYYSVDPHCLTRFWRDAEAKRDGDTWVADCPVLSVDQPLYVYANVSYTLKTERLGFRGYKAPDTFLISSREAIVFPEELKAAGVKATDKPSRLIDDFSRGWQDWYRLEWGNAHAWVATTRKLKDLKWRGPEGAKLVFDIRCPQDNVLKVTVILNDWGVFPGKGWSEHFTALTPIKGSAEWQTISLSLDDMISDKKDKPSKLTSWETVTQLSFGWSRSYFKDGQEVKVGSDNSQQNGWREPREFRNMRWEGGTEAAAAAPPASKADVTPPNLEETIQKEIRKSVDQENRDVRTRR
jgi:dienelactone hydrolase